MSNHIYLILQSETQPLSDIIRDPIAIGFKKFTAKKMLLYIETSNQESRKEWMLNKFEFNAKKNLRNSKYQVWTHDNHAEELLTTKFPQLLGSCRVALIKAHLALSAKLEYNVANHSFTISKKEQNE